VRATDCIRACLGHTEVQNLSFFDQLLHRPHHFLDRYLRVDAMLVKQVDTIGFQPFEGGFDDGLDGLWTAVQTLAWHTLFKAELCGDDHLIPDWRQCFT
jgi:hypothetical protein